MLSLLWLAGLGCCLGLNVPPLIGYDCTDPRSNYTVLDLTQIEECDQSVESYPQRAVKVQVIQTRTYRPIHVYTCLIQFMRVIHHCGMHSHISVVPKGYHTRLHTVGREGCLALHRDLSMRIGTHLIDELSSNATTIRHLLLAGRVGETGTCHGGSYSDEMGTYTSVVVQAVVEISLFDYTGTATMREEMLMIPRTNVMCPVKNSYCLDTQQGEAAWTYQDESLCPKVEIDILYEGDAEVVGEGAEQVLVVSHPGRTFAFRIVKPTQLCGRMAYTTEHALIYVSEKGPMGYYWPDGGSMYSKNVDLTMHIGSKFLYVTQTITRNIHSLMVAFTRSECVTRRLVLENRLILASLSPDRVSLLTEGSGVYGRVLGEAMYIVRCAPVPVLLRYTTECYQEIPVTHNNASYYLSPVTRLVVPVGREVPCKALLHPRFQIGDKWYIRTPELISVPPPRRLDPNEPFKWDQHTLIDVALGGLYSDEQLRNLQGEMMFPAMREAVGTTVTRRIMASMQGDHINAQSLFSPTDLSALTDAVAARISWFFALFGHYASIVLGMYVVWKVVLYTINTALNCFILRRHGKRRLELCAGMLDACTSLLTVHKEVRWGKAMKTSEEVTGPDPVTAQDTDLSDEELDPPAGRLKGEDWAGVPIRPTLYPPLHPLINPTSAPPGVKDDFL